MQFDSASRLAGVTIPGGTKISHTYDYGGRSKTKWAQKHDTILWYARDPARYTFRPSESDRLPYMAPGLVTAEMVRPLV